VEDVARADDDIPTGRLRRTARVGGLLAGQAARAAATRAANAARTDSAARAASERRQAEAAEQIVDVLGQMKGAAMKVGQVASFVDTGAFPPEVQERFQLKLGELRDAAPAVSFDRMRAVVEGELAAPLAGHFRSFEPDAVAAASIGQVYRAELHDGRRVAVKVQYPGVAAAVRADLHNLGLLLRAARRIAPGMDPKAIAGEVRERVTEELDYEHEAANQRAFARGWRGHPFVVIPEVVSELCTESVLVTEWVDGTRFEDVKRLPAAQRDRVGEIVLRFFFGSLYRTGHFSGDPHPGNFLLMDDGRVAFLDFGMTKAVPREHVAAEVAVIRAGMLGDAEGLHGGLARLGFFDAEDAVMEPARVLAHFRAATAWYGEDRPFTIDPEYVGRVMIDLGDPRSEYWDLMKRETVPPQALLGRRMEAMVLAVLGQLRATANWHGIVREWLFAAPPSTPLGEQDAAYWRGRGVLPVAAEPPAERAA
jgi:predicted unusual protein kinase regulating ubiquinone biosynthesis (AarF/ABC1/UbiB family)